MSLQEKLRQLFLLDQQLRGMRSRLDGAMDRLKMQRKKHEQLTRQQAELNEQLKAAQVKATAAEKQSAEVEERVDHLRTQMNSVKNNKEYSALLIEVNTLKIDKSKMEDEALEQLGKVEQLKREMEAINLEIASREKLVAGADGEVTACRAELGQQLDELTAKRNQAEEEVPLDARSIFKRVAIIHDGEAMAHIVEEDRRNMEYSCSGCYMQLPIERVNALMRKQDEVVICPSCGRILYLEPDLKAAISSK